MFVLLFVFCVFVSEIAGWGEFNIYTVTLKYPLQISERGGWRGGVWANVYEITEL